MSDICMYGVNSAAAFRGRIIGGAELQIMLLAKGLAQAGMSVTIIDPMTAESWQPSERLFVRGVPGWGRGVRGLRLLTHRMPQLLRALRESRARVYYSRGFSFLNLVPLGCARMCGGTFVQAAAADTELMGMRERYRHLYKGTNIWGVLSTVLPNELGNRILVRNADIVLVQNEDQRVLALRRAKRVIRLNNVVDNELFSIESSTDRKNIIVVGAISVRKGLQALFPVIEELRQVTFEFVGKAENVQGESAWNVLSRFPNVVLHGELNRDQTIRKIAGAKALLNVSRREGFPNAFLEAWAVRTPVISLYVDPGGIITTHKLGYVCGGDIRKLVQLLRQDGYDLDTERGREFVVAHHSLESALRVFKEILNHA